MLGFEFEFERHLVLAGNQTYIFTRCSVLSLSSSVTPPGLSGPTYGKSVGFRPRLNSFAASRLKAAQHQKAGARSC